MIFEKIYSFVRTKIIVWGSAIGAGVFYTFVITGICRLLFKMEENTALLWIGVPFFLLFTILALIYLPKRLRKAGFIE